MNLAEKIVTQLLSEDTDIHTYCVVTDSVTTEIAATSPDEAAEKFAASEQHLATLNIHTVADLAEARAKVGGWAKVVLI